MVFSPEKLLLVSKFDPFPSRRHWRLATILRMSRGHSDHVIGLNMLTEQRRGGNKFSVAMQNTYLGCVPLFFKPLFQRYEPQNFRPQYLSLRLVLLHEIL